MMIILGIIPYILGVLMTAWYLFDHEDRLDIQDEVNKDLYDRISKLEKR